MEFNWLFKLNWFIILGYTVPYCVAITDDHAKTSINGQVIKYLKMYNDKDIGNVVFVETSTESVDVEKWFKYVTLTEEDLHFDSFFPFTYLSNAFKNPNPKFTRTLSKSPKSSLIIVNNFEASEYSQNILKGLSETLLRDHIWLFLYPYANITVEHFGSLLIGKESENLPNLRLNSQVKLFIPKML